ncbi:MAG: helix-turn-helix domain-containing protein [Flavobacteriales bacterium]
MTNFLHVNSISDIHNILNSKMKHPLISVVDLGRVSNPNIDLPKVVVGFYGIIYMPDSNCIWKYGRNQLDFNEGTLIFISPGQTLEIERKDAAEGKQGWAVFFHPDLLLGTSLKLNKPEYNFFSYDVSEALHISDKEKRTLNDVVTKIEEEIDANLDRHSKRLIVSNVELLLNYCIRYYDRQFITREPKNNDIVTQFEQFILEYINQDSLIDKGLPSVADCAERLHLSPSYLSDLLKKETGKSTLEHIHYHIINKAKYILLNSTCSVQEVAFQLGFEYPQSFSKLFKKNVKVSPKQFRNVN